MAKVLMAEAARGDLRDIRVYSKSAFGPIVARAYLEGLRQSFRLLADQPMAGAAEYDLGDNVRGFSYKSHRLYYRIENGHIWIIRILHHARDAASIMDRDH